MSYTTGGLIEATDYNNFVSNTPAANVNAIWAAGTGDSGYGQLSLPVVAPGAVVTAVQWATLVNTISLIASHQGTPITTRTPPTAGNLIAVLNSINSDLVALNQRRGYAAAMGSAIGTFSGSVSKTAATIVNRASWTITFTQTVTFASATAARYFFNAGGLIKLMYKKGSNVYMHDTVWNNFINQAGTIWFTGRIAGQAQQIASNNFTGTTRLNGTGGTQTLLAATTGFYNLTPGAPAVTIFQLNNAGAPYVAEYLRTTVALNAAGTQLTFVTTWYDDGTTGPTTSSNIAGGTATTSPATSITGTAPTTLLNVILPSTTRLTPTWGTPTIACSVT